MIDLSNIEANEPKVNVEEYITLVYGKPKSGKTSFFVKLLKVVYGEDGINKGLLIATEKGYKALKVKKQDINRFEDFMEVTKQLVRDKERLPYTFLCIDTVDELHRYAVEYVIKREGLKDGKKYIALNDIPWGKGHEMVLNEIVTPLKSLFNAGYGLQLITHDTDKKFESRDGVSYDKTTCSLPDKIRNSILNMADFINYIDIAKEKDELTGKIVDKRYIYFRASGSDLEAGSRFENVPEKIIYDAELYYQTFQNAVLTSLGDIEDGKNIEDIRQSQKIEAEVIASKYRESKEMDKDVLLADLKKAHVDATDSAKGNFTKFMVDNKITMETFEPLQIKEGIKILSQK